MFIQRLLEILDEILLLHCAGDCKQVLCIDTTYLYGNVRWQRELKTCFTQSLKWRRFQSGFASPNGSGSCLQALLDAAAQVELQVGGKALVSELASLPLAIAGAEDNLQPIEGEARLPSKETQRLQSRRKSPRLKNHWQLKEQIGQGSFGEVWQALRHSSLGSGNTHLHLMDLLLL